ncbi:DUF1364 family protein [Salmonella enterica subsp. enterica serovar Oslo]|uniref:nuclease domain-containing protein n=1 Tax=Salmonella enterica TaxID=28901 RepID=UPI00288CAD0E|nr:nuclease domain-containing protein [Salmonella enterica]MDT1785972.1 DUF1364 family protein [Salmonella enterica subsp. enterica serovar Oslo]
MKKIDLKNQALERMLTLRIPGICNFNTETSVLAHYRMSDTSGTCIKPQDMQCAIASNTSHHEIDGSLKTYIDKDTMRQYQAEGVFRNQQIWRE